MTARVDTGGQLKGWHVLALMLGFFGLVIGVNVAFAYFAVRSFPGEEVQSPYQQGLHYNDALAARRAQAALGWRATAELLPAGGGDAVVVVELQDRAGAPLNGAALEGALRWPTDGARDQPLRFVFERDGRYRAIAPQLPRGNWRLEARAVDDSGGALDFDADFLWR